MTRSDATESAPHARTWRIASAAATAASPFLAAGHRGSPRIDVDANSRASAIASEPPRLPGARVRQAAIGPASTRIDGVRRDARPACITAGPEWIQAVFELISPPTVPLTRAGSAPATFATTELESFVEAVTHPRSRDTTAPAAGRPRWLDRAVPHH